MLVNKKGIKAWFDFMENEEHLSEQDIIDRCMANIEDANFFEDYIHEINDELYRRGYNSKFLVKKNKSVFEANVYFSLLHNAFRSSSNTKKLIDYLHGVDDYRLAFMSWQSIKVKYLVDLGYLPKENYYINSTLSVKEMFFDYYSKDDSKFEDFYRLLENIGISYPDLDYNKFRYDMEYLLWSYEKNQSAGDIKTNTVKLVLNMTPKEYLINGDKKLFNEKLSLKVKDYLKAININRIKRVISKWPNYYDDNTGYTLLYRIFSNRVIEK